MRSLWPFRRKTKDGDKQQALNEKTPPPRPQAAAMPAPPPSSSHPRSSSKRRRPSQNETTTEGQSVKSSRRQGSAVGKENVIPGRDNRGSVEDITALPLSRRLDSSPHLRPIDSQRPQIPYNFRPYSLSQTSLQRTEATPSRPQTIQSKRSTYSGPPTRRPSTKRRKDDALREEEIRAMTAPIPIPKRPGDGPLRRDSKKRRSMRDSNISLPHQDSIHSSMSGVMEQRGWEVGSFGMFSPRPAVRLSGTPQYVGSGSVPGSSSRPSTARAKDKDKTPIRNEFARKRQTIGEEADDFDAGDIRMLMERDAKRRERRRKEQQEKLDRKLRSRGGRNRGDSDRKRQEEEEAAKEKDTRQAEDVQRRHELMTPPRDVHPAFRESPNATGESAAGLGMGVSAVAGAAVIDPERAQSHAMPTTAERGVQNTGTYLDYKQHEREPENPFSDPAGPPTPLEQESDIPRMPGAFTPLESPLEDPMSKDTQGVNLPQTQTPPLSPVRSIQTERANSGPVPTINRPHRPLSDLPPPPPIPTSERRTSEPKDRRAGGWASLFRRGGTLRKPDEPSTPSELSFSNASRESMRNLPLPAHLVDSQAPRSKSTGAPPMRAKSKFREDLPELPISPPDSRIPSPDVNSAAAATAAARRSKKAQKSADPLERARDMDVDASSIGRNDTPVSPSQRARGLMSASLASVDSEGSWLASSGKRQSTQSALSRSIGSLRQRRPDFAASYEELGEDRDAEHFTRKAPSPAHGGAEVDSVSDYGDSTAIAEAQADPMTVHGSVRRKPTLVHRDPRVKSREGLLAEYAGGESAEIADATAEKDDFDPEPELRSARSVNYGKGGKHHGRQMSAGSAKLLDIKRPSMEASHETAASPPAVAVQPSSPSSSPPP
ncbi:hypothetical protein D0863_07783 [Hortaea werneckii]|uniref:Uncharacterized protein n=1 Tax=Hortaea werneckii TaxID=91943 RepID=A0A3M7DSW9_HORWE|nr:hypothetical protein D0863_07783 [Hortaea werneckii]